MDERLVTANLQCLLDNHDRVGAPDFKDIIVFEGSARSSKTWSIIEYIINVLAQEKLVATCFRYDAVTHTTSTLRDFKDIMQMPDYSKLWKEGSFNGQDKTFTFKNGSIFEFKGTKDPAKLHGPERDIAWLNELEHTYESYRQIVARTRVLTIIDFNPSLSKHWVFSKVMTRDNCLYMHSTYRDNPHLAQKIVAEIEATEDTPRNREQGTVDKYFWSVYGLGQRAKREGAVFKEWFLVDAKEWPDPWMTQRHGYGLDFGFSNDPAVLVECALHNSKLHAKEIFRETGLITCKSHANPNKPSIQGLLELNKIPKTAMIVADNARPEQIAELCDCGYIVVACEKGPDSVVGGINLMDSFMIHLHSNSTFLHEEFDQYAWARKPDGTWTDVPEDRFNHSVDAIRYWAMKELARLSSDIRQAKSGRVARKLRTR